ncbi:MAG: aspartate--tRNA ligase [Actinomycetota bacterium]|nr:aspartate--tRNA ligase [Actinomycetota bacterium]
MGPALRTTGAGELDAERVGEEVRLAGWVAARRDHGGVIFLDLRDHTGLVQVVVNPQDQPGPGEAAEEVRLEYCLAVDGHVRRRPEGTVNLNLPTGEVEVVARDLEVLSPSDPLPFPISDRVEADELTRLEYRYLDMRRPSVAANLRARSSAIRTIRGVLDGRGFLEVETPHLIRSTPEGARDLLVPSRLRPGQFYALPQSPQLFKQLLMVAGVPRYYQIARCYRDEDFRSDRQIEFTQLDLEGSFWEEEDVQETLEAVMVGVVEALRGERPLVPFPRITYSEAIARYGTDKPDVRPGSEIRDLSELFRETEFRAFAGSLASGQVVRGLNAGPQESSRSHLDELVASAQAAGARGLVWMVVEGGDALRSPVAKFLSQQETLGLIDALQAKPGDLLLLVADQPTVASSVLGRLRTKLVQPPDGTKLSFVWVTEFPVFEETPEGELVPAHHPFTAPADIEQMRDRPAEAISRAYDLVLNGSELGSGSVRIHDPQLQRRVFEILGISEEDAERRFGWFLRALRFGAPPHAGFALGIDRLLAILQGEPNIREVIPFPKTQTGLDPLTKSPTPVDEAHLAELGIELRREVREALEKEE